MLERVCALNQFYTKAHPPPAFIVSDKQYILKTDIHEPSYNKQLCTFTRQEQELIKLKLRLTWNSCVNFSHTATINNTSNSFTS